MKNEQSKLPHRVLGIVFTAFWIGALAAGSALAEEPFESGPMTVAGKPAEAGRDPFLGEPQFNVRSEPLFRGERMPNVVVTTAGTVLAVWGDVRQRDSDAATPDNVRVRRSEDGGDTWGPQIAVGRGLNGGGVTVDERTGKVFVFVEESHPKTLEPPPLTVYCSADDGKTWQPQDVEVVADPNGHVPAMSMAERGITLRHGERAGRLLRPARVFEGGASRRGYNSAVYSDDRGATWRASAPFPAEGTGEGTLAELSDGRIYYNSRRHWAPQGENPRRRHVAHSDDGGETWTNLSVSDVLPDGAQHRDYGLMAGLVRLPVQGRDILVFSNIVSNGGRHNGHVWASLDGGRTWPIKRQVDEGGFAYSSLAAGRPGTPSEGCIYLLYEGAGGGRIARFNLAWLLEGEPTGDGQAPELQ